MRRARLLIADDHPVVLAGLRQLLESEFQVVGTAADGRMLVKAALSLEPDVILLDISMPLLNGLTAARQIRKAQPDVKLIFLTMHPDADYVREAFRCGASGYILKRSAASELAFAIREVLQGRIYLSPVIAGGFDGRLPGSRSAELTGRQTEVLQLLAEGHSSKEIAGILNISIKTVEFHKSAIRARLRLGGTAELTRYALEHKIVGA